MQKLLIVDGNSMLFRAFYATIYGRPMTTSSGVYTNAIYGFVNMFSKALSVIEPDYVFVAFDAGKHTFRHDLYADYKGGRKPAPEELVPQFAMIREFLDSFHVKWLERVDIEADDLIGSLAKKYPDIETDILSSDHDMLQLIDKTTSVWIMKKGVSDIEEIDETALMNDKGIIPSQIIDLKGLMGDSADNIPGIPGIGEKTALKLLTQYKTVEGLYEHIDELKGKQKDKIMECKDLAFLSKKLATINTHVDLDFTIEDCLFKPDYMTGAKYLDSLEMKHLSAQFREKIDTEVNDSFHFEVVKELNKDFFKEKNSCVLNMTVGTFMNQEIMGIAFSNGKDQIYITLEDFMKQKECINDLSFVGFDIKNEMHGLDRYDLKIRYDFDAMVSAFLGNSSLNSYEKIIENYELIQNNTYKDIYGSIDSPKMIDDSLAIEYVCQKASNILKIFERSLKELKKYDMESLFYDVEMALIPVLYGIEKEGIICDVKVLDDIAQETLFRMNVLTENIYGYVGHSFNINSPKQLGNVLYDELALPGGKKRSTSVEMLDQLEPLHPIITDIKKYRKLSKLYSTYAEGLKRFIMEDGKIHTTLNQCITETGRLSSSNPNLQNISVRDEDGKEIRKAFLPSKDHVLVSCDYSQVELRMLAHMAKEERLIEAFKSGLDIHTKTAMDVFNVEKDDVTSDMRRKAKAVNFGVVYGISDFGLAKQLDIPRKSAKQYIDNYFEKYPNIEKYMNDIVAFCQEKGYVETLLHRRRLIPEINDKAHMVREFGKRAAMNAPIQGSAADLIKLAMINIDKAMREKNVKSKMILQIHDELIFDVCNDEIEVMTAIIEDGMQNAMHLSVPLEAKCSMGKTWYEAK